MALGPTTVDDAATSVRRPLTAAVLKTAVSIGVLGLLLWRVPPAELISAAASAGWAGYLGVTVGLALFLLLGALRVHLTVGAFASVPFRTVAWLYWRSVALGAFTPGQVGELSLVLFLKRRGVDTAQSLAISAVDRVTTLATLLGLALVGLLVYLPNAVNGWLWLMIAVCAAAVSALYVRPWRKRVRLVVERTAPRALPFFEAFCRFFLSYPLRVTANMMLGLARWACAALMLLVLIEPQMPVPVDRAFVMVANAAARLVTYVPISINGIGVLELSAVELFRLGGIPAHLTLAAFIVNRIVYYLFASALVVGMTWAGGRPSGSSRIELTPEVGPH
jgi:uncharacterized protein (TIRG00374 family)